MLCLEQSDHAHLGGWFWLGQGCTGQTLEALSEIARLNLASDRILLYVHVIICNEVYHHVALSLELFRIHRVSNVGIRELFSCELWWNLMLPIWKFWSETQLCGKISEVEQKIEWSYYLCYVALLDYAKWASITCCFVGFSELALLRLHFLVWPTIVFGLHVSACENKSGSCGWHVLFWTKYI